MDCFCIHTSFSLKVDKKRTYEYGKGRKTPEKRVSVLAYLLKISKLTREECRSEVCVYTNFTHFQICDRLFNTSYRCFSKLKMAL